MILHSAETIKAMHGREVLAHVVERFREDGESVLLGAKAAARVYGAGAVSPEVMQRAEMLFQAAHNVEAVARKATAGRTNEADRAAARKMADEYRAALLSAFPDSEAKVEPEPVHHPVDAEESEAA